MLFNVKLNYVYNEFLKRYKKKIYFDISIKHWFIINEFGKWESFDQYYEIYELKPYLVEIYNELQENQNNTNKFLGEHANDHIQKLINDIRKNVYINNFIIQTPLHLFNIYDSKNIFDAINNVVKPISCNILDIKSGITKPIIKTKNCENVYNKCSKFIKRINYMFEFIYKCFRINKINDVIQLNILEVRGNGDIIKCIMRSIFEDYYCSDIKKQKDYHKIIVLEYQNIDYMQYIYSNIKIQNLLIINNTSDKIMKHKYIIVDTLVKFEFINITNEILYYSMNINN